jgi:L-alanine-DL-glutamate epimerase-like enolase superfamily enzyme
VFSPQDALKILQTKAADLINIKLMKCGGLYNALKIADAAEMYGTECMIGCMLEAKVSVNAAVHLACAKQVITKIDLDGPVLCSEDPVDGGAVFHEKEITVSDGPGLGIRGVRGVRWLD